MDDLISRQAAIDAVKDAVIKDEQQYAEDALKALPSAQPEIIRCKDCKHRSPYWGNCRLLEEKYHQGVLVDNDDFCSRAERRTNEGSD